MIRRDGCARYAAILFDLVDGGGPAVADVDAALRHLDTCGRCSRDLEEVVPVVARLRRLGVAARGRTSAADPWPAVARSIGASPPGRRRPILAWLTGPLGGVIAMPLVAAMLLVTVGPRLAVGPLAATPYLSETEGLPPPSGEVPSGARIPHDHEPGSAAYLAVALAWATGQQTDSSVPSARPTLRAERVPAAPAADTPLTDLPLPAADGLSAPTDPSLARMAAVSTQPGPVSDIAPAAASSTERSTSVRTR